jgi:hypothetical protein
MSTSFAFSNYTGFSKPRRKELQLGLHNKTHLALPTSCFRAQLCQDIVNTTAGLAERVAIFLTRTTRYSVLTSARETTTTTLWKRADD